MDSHCGLHVQFGVLLPVEALLLTMILNPWNCSVALCVTIIKRILVKQVVEYLFAGKALVSSIDHTFCVEPQHSCPKDLRELEE